MRRPSCLVLLSTALLAVAFGAGQAHGQCILANPSFEIAGSGGAVFGGWNQFGAVGMAGEAVHGARAARVSGPDTGGWDVSGFWQEQDCVPGEQWEVAGHVRHPAGKPLTGVSAAIVNVEWRTAAGALISYDSFAVADAGSAPDAYAAFGFVSSAAPANTAKARLLLGVLQAPGEPSPDAWYDQVTFHSTTAPTIDDVQWQDFPGGRTVAFAGRTWRVKGPGFYGPGANLFCHLPDCVWVDGDGQLHLTLSNRSGNWYATEVVTEETLGYGDYVLTTVGRLDLLDPLAVLGIFLWQYGPCWDDGYLWWNAFNEIDIEYSRWTDPGASIGQFVAQPYNWSGNLERFDYDFAPGEVTSHAMRWLADRVEYRVWRGGPGDESPANLIHAWTYTGPHIPRPERPRLHLNLWRITGAPAANQEIVFRDFVFVPEGGVSAVEDGPPATLPAAPAGRLLPAVPNPFNPRTTVRFALARAGEVELAVYDPGGRLVRALVSGPFAAGEHAVVWDGLDRRGQGAASGVYLVVLRGGNFVESQRVTLVR
ncbi:MAG: hypothetical protein IH621_11970 [Krumholzibacteria bacterium]|nr:hypothetical protein [Candidatus Krumholzibacteria bacterium]